MTQWLQQEHYMGDTQFKLLILSDRLLYKTLEKDHTFRLIADSFLVDNCTMSGPFTMGHNTL